jgi:hypothetical protein
MESYMTFMAEDKTIPDHEIEEAMKSSGFKERSFIIRKSIEFIVNDSETLTLNQNTPIAKKVKEAVSKSRTGIIPL